MTLEEITSEMQSRVAAKGAIDGKVVKFDFGDDGKLTIDGAADPATVNNDDAGPPPAQRRRLSLENFGD